MEQLKGLLDAILKLFNVLVQTYGPYGALAIFAILVLGMVLWRVRTQRRRDREVDAALAANERALQRAAAENREYRVIFCKQLLGWNDDQIDRFILRGEFSTPQEAREALESDQRQPPTSK